MWFYTVIIYYRSFASRTARTWNRRRCRWWNSLLNPRVTANNSYVQIGEAAAYKLQLLKFTEELSVESKRKYAHWMMKKRFCCRKCSHQVEHWDYYWCNARSKFVLVDRRWEFRDRETPRVVAAHTTAVCLKNTQSSFLIGRVSLDTLNSLPPYSARPQNYKLY